MWIKSVFLFLWLTSVAQASVLGASASDTFDVLVIGGGASGSSAAITAARMGARTALVEEGPWLGGMLTAGGVSAFDGNHKIAGGIFREFRDSLYQWYGGPSAVETGWVSNTLFEPKTGFRIFRNIATKENNLAVFLKSELNNVEYSGGFWRVTLSQGDMRAVLLSPVLIDATELGDIAAQMGVEVTIGMESRSLSGEIFAPEEANNIVQDLTWVAILKTYPDGSNHILTKPPGYNPEIFRCCCDTRDPSTSGAPLLDCKKMLEYGRLPNGRYMINWPNCGNDIYLNVIDMAPSERKIALEQAKVKTLQFVYYIQQELGFKHLGLADDEFPTKDRLPLIPYHRESRRIMGKSRLKVHHILNPFDQQEAYYRTGIAVGDYPIDHHHKENPETPKIDFIQIKAPSYNIPLGSLIPEKDIPIIVAEKSISVSNIVNGTTRLQPVVLGIGQAAGTTAALASRKGVSPAKVGVRDVQQELLLQGAYIMPYIDVIPSNVNFASIQRIGATGLLRGQGIPYKWANQTWFYPDSICVKSDLHDGWVAFYGEWPVKSEAMNENMTVQWLYKLMQTQQKELNLQHCLGVLTSKFRGISWHAWTVLSRRQVAILLDEILQPFSRPVDYNGHFIQP